MIIKQQSMNQIESNFGPTLMAKSELTIRLKKYFAVGDYNHWELMDNFILFSSTYFHNKPGLDVIYAYIDYLNERITEDVELVPGYSFRETFINVAKMVCKKKGCRVSSIKRTARASYSHQLTQNDFFVRNAIRSRVFTRFLLGKIRKIAGKGAKKKADVVFLSNIRFSKETPENHSIYGPVMEELSRKKGLGKVSYKTIFYEELIQLHNLRRVMKEFLLSDADYLGDYYTLKQLRQNKKDFKLLRRRWRELRDDPKFKRIFVYKGYDYYDLIKPRLELIFNALSYIACDNKNLTAGIAAREDYSVLVIDHDENMYGKGVMIATKDDKKKKTLALSHELIYPGCMHTHVRDELVKDRKNLIWRPIPDIKCVWGEFGKRTLLESCNYEKDVIRVTGNPAFDRIINKKHDKKEILRKYPFLDDKRKKLLIASDCTRPTYPLYRKMIEQNPDVLFILKPHHYEDIGLLKDMFEPAPENFHMVDKLSDLYELIDISDFVITHSSTAGFEALLFDKVLLITLPPGFKLVGLPYSDSGAALPIHKPEELKSTIKSLEEASFRQRLAEKRHRFVMDVNYKADGKASARVADEIVKLVKRK
jgi:hypothetical protein